MIILPILTYLLSSIAIKIPKHYFIELENITKFNWKNQMSKFSRELMQRNIMDGGQILSSIIEHPSSKLLGTD